MGRTSKADLEAQAEEAFRQAVTALGHNASRGNGQADFTVTVDSVPLIVELRAASVITPDAVTRIVESVDKRRKTVAHVAVGDLITTPAQDALREAGWGWLDRRGHLVLRAKGIHIDAEVPPDARPTTAPRSTISGVAAISWAAALLLSPDDPPSMRSVARQVSISHSAIVAASKRLKAAALIRSDGRPVVPELFWALAEEWRPTWVPLAQLPDDDSHTALGVNTESDRPGWALAGTVGAAAWGAPIALGAAYPPDLYVPTTVELRQATLRLGPVPSFDARACSVAVAPTPLVCVPRYERASKEWGQWRFAHGLFAALDLAQDRARGAEILDGWNPEDFTRVW